MVLSVAKIVVQYGEVFCRRKPTHLSPTRITWRHTSVRSSLSAMAGLALERRTFMASCSLGLLDCQRAAPCRYAFADATKHLPMKHLSNLHVHRGVVWTPCWSIVTAANRVAPRQASVLIFSILCFFNVLPDHPFLHPSFHVASQVSQREASEESAITHPPMLFRG